MIQKTWPTPASTFCCLNFTLSDHLKKGAWVAFKKKITINKKIIFGIGQFCFPTDGICARFREKTFTKTWIDIPLENFSSRSWRRTKAWQHMSMFSKTSRCDRPPLANAGIDLFASRTDQFRGLKNCKGSQIRGPEEQAKLLRRNFYFLKRSCKYCLSFLNDT